jgi:hypothetical protein
MSTVAVCGLVLGLLVVDLLALRFGSDSRPDIGRLPDRWFGAR